LYFETPKVMPTFVNAVFDRAFKHITDDTSEQGRDDP